MDLINYYRLMRFDKPIGILLLLWPTLWALWIASKGHPSLIMLGIFVAGVILMRAAGCVINDIADRHIDGRVARTEKRPLPQQTISVKSALVLFVFLCSLAFVLVLFLNRLTIHLALVALMLASTYPFMKRFTHWPQAFLGLAFSWGIPMAFAAQMNSIPYMAWWLFFTTILWVILYDTQYAMVDREDDLKIGVKSTAILFSHYDRVIIGVLQALVLASLVGIGYYLKLKPFFYSGLSLALILAVYQQFLIRERDAKQCFKAFLNNHWFGCVVFVGIVLGF